jgi:DNA polymerase I
MAKSVMLIDVNGLGFAAQNTKTRLYSGEVETTAVFGVLRSIIKLRSNFAGDPIVLWDGRSWRYDVHPTYKGNREKNPEIVAVREAWRAQRPATGRMLNTIGVRQVLASNMEADDLAARLRRRLVDAGKDVTLVTGDKDWLQLLEENVHAWDPIRERLIGLHNFKETTGLPAPSCLAPFKALTGDSDNIKGVGGIGPKTAMAIFEQYGSVSGFISAMMGDLDLRKLADARALKLMDSDRQDAFKYNMRLIMLDHPQVPEMEGFKSVGAEFNEEAFRELCEEYAFTSILRDWTQVVNILSRKDS